jgi:RNA polymerase sigma factor (sigma-70 family)
VETADAAILDAVARGDRQLAASLILRHFGPALLGQARAIAGTADADDVLMATIMALLSALERGRFAGRGSLRSYAITTARYQAFHLRDSGWRRMWRNAEDPGSDLPAPPPSERPWGHQDEDALAARLVAALDVRSRVVVVMRVEGAAFSRIAKVLRISAASARQIHVGDPAPPRAGRGGAGDARGDPVGAPYLPVARPMTSASNHDPSLAAAGWLPSGMLARREGHGYFLLHRTPSGSTRPSATP